MHAVLNTSIPFTGGCRKPDSDITMQNWLHGHLDQIVHDVRDRRVCMWVRVRACLDRYGSSPWVGSHQDHHIDLVASPRPSAHHRGAIRRRLRSLQCRLFIVQISKSYIWSLTNRNAGCSLGNAGALTTGNRNNRDAERGKNYLSKLNNTIMKEYAKVRRKTFE